FHQGEGDVGHGVYVKGASVLQMLRGMLGEEIFWKGVQRYTQNHLNQLVETRDLQRAFEDVSGRNLGWFFQQWVELPHVPELSVRWQHQKGVLDVTVKQSGGKEQPMYTLPIEIEVGSQKTVTYHKSWIDDRSTRISIPMEKAPDYVAFDPKKAILAKVTYEQDASEWKAQLQSPSAHARLDAIYGLKEAKGAAELGAVLVDVTRHAVLRSTAAKQLGEMGEGSLMMEGLKDPHAAVRKASIQALEKTTYKESVPTLLGLYKKDPNPDVRARVLDTLAALEPKKALELARKEVKSKKFRPAMLYSMLGVFRTLGALSDIPNILEYGKKHGIRGSVLWSLTTILNREELGTKRSKMRERIARYTEDLLYDQNQRVREAAIRILREVGDDRSIAHLKTLIQTENLSSFHESARSSIKEIRSRDDSISSKTPNEEAARLKEIEERLENLEKDYKKLIEKY
ncbi:MAG: HEAT repeat domain-containing protein, partial [Myxococcota bacterium]|nr:HEAT repeat domain-containing protein [Myxococcota bacterium]